jgi:hypothetical protein
MHHNFFSRRIHSITKTIVMLLSFYFASSTLFLEKKTCYGVSVFPVNTTFDIKVTYIQKQSNAYFLITLEFS